MAARVIRFPAERTRRPPPPVNPWAEAIAWWLTWAANITQEVADAQSAMAKALVGPR